MENIADKGLKVEMRCGGCSRLGKWRVDQVVGVGQGWIGFGRVAGHAPNVALLDFSVKVGCHKRQVYFCGKLLGGRARTRRKPRVAESSKTKPQRGERRNRVRRGWSRFGGRESRFLAPLGIDKTFQRITTDVRRPDARRPGSEVRILTPFLLHSLVLFFFRGTVPAQQLREVLGERRAGQDHVASDFVSLLLQVSLDVRQESDDRCALLQLAL